MIQPGLHPVDGPRTSTRVAVALLATWMGSAACGWVARTPAEPRLPSWWTRTFSSDPPGHAARAREVRRLAVGDRVFAGTPGDWEAGTLSQIRDQAPFYFVRYDPGSIYVDASHWPSRLVRVGHDLSTKGSELPEDTFGTWKPILDLTTWMDAPGNRYLASTVPAAPLNPGVSVPPGPRESLAEAASRALEELTYGTQNGPMLTIRADGRYEWTRPGQPPIRGQWEREPNPDVRKGVVRLPVGESGKTWWVGYAGRASDGRPEIRLRADFGVYATESICALSE